MSVSVTLPKMGESVVEGTIIRWLKQEGEQVNEDEPLVEISTDKIDAEMPSPASGVLAKIIVGPDQTVDVGTEIAVIDEAGAQPAPPASKKEAAPPAKSESTAPEATAEPQPSKKQAAAPKQEKPAAKQDQPAPTATPDGNGRALTSPLVRKLAREQGVDITHVPGSGPGGRVTKEDVLAAAAGSARGAAPTAAAPRPPIAAMSDYSTPAGEYEDVAFSHVRRSIAEHMSKARHTAADVTNVVEVDMTRVAQIRSRSQTSFEAAEGFRLSFLPFVASAVVQALRTFPEFNAHILEDGKTARLYRQVNLGIAVGRDEGLIVPVIHGADGMNVVGLARAIRDIAERARTKGGLRPDDVTGATFTITNYGSFGGVIDTPIIPQPQIAILGTGAVVKRPVVVSLDGNDAIAIRQMSFHSLSYDHRWVDGHKAAQFNSHIRAILEAADFAHELGVA